jgi:uncharacterized Zn finger protein (UPF0148 family)
MSGSDMTECPFCDFEPHVAKEDVKTSPEKEVQEVYKHLEKEHPDRSNELSTDALDD